jgi:Zn finger protein HypA/HybF involved in hydrogenase expression
MQLSEIFAKDIQRPIEGVIKADDVAHLGIEVDEYVLTNEAAKGLEILLEEYTSYTNANGVDLRLFSAPASLTCSRCSPTSLATSKARTTGARASPTASAPRPDAFLPGLLNKAERIPGRSLLFNIDQKATLISKDQTDALLKVFVKVLDESRGYYGNQGHVARFERDLDSRGQYEAFKEAFERITGIPWIQGREQSALEGSSIDRAFAEVNSGTADGIIRQYSASYSVSIEDFADEVKAWLDKQDDPNFRLNFFVDEVGQFIGSDTKLMLNLQTIAESLNTVRRPLVGVRDLSGGHGEGHRRPNQAAGQRLLQDPGPFQHPPEAHQRRRRGGHPQASAGEERSGPGLAQQGLRRPARQL